MSDGLDARVVVRRPSGFRLSLEVRVEAGSTVALLGPNGAGKSTAVWAMAGVVPLDHGRVSLAGRVLEDTSTGAWVPPDQRRIGAVFQDVLLFPHLSVAQNVAFAVRTGPPGDAERAALARLDDFGLADLARLRPSQLSGGQAQQVGLARALAGDPALLLLDEPFSALDVGTRAQVRRSLSSHLASFPGPTLLITHDPAEAFLMADRVVVLEEGAVTQTGTPDEIRRHPATGYAADLAGVNLITGRVEAGLVEVAGGPRLRIPDTSLSGDVLLTVHPRAVAIHHSAPLGSARNAWRSEITAVEPLGDCCRVQFGAPLPLTSEVTATAQLEMGLEPGRVFWVAIKATEIAVRPA